MTDKHRVVICGSMAFLGAMLDTKTQLMEAGVQAVTPDPDDLMFVHESEDVANAYKREASLRHIRRVRDPQTYAILVMNYDKHGIPDYIGPNSFAEIAVALAHYKSVYLFQGIPEFYREELAAWGAICLHSEITGLVRDLRRLRRGNDRQLMLF